MVDPSSLASSCRSGPSDVLIEAASGLGGKIVMGSVEPDSYVFDSPGTRSARKRLAGGKSFCAQTTPSAIPSRQQTRSFFWCLTTPRHARSPNCANTRPASSDALTKSSGRLARPARWCSKFARSRPAKRRHGARGGPRHRIWPRPRRSRRGAAAFLFAASSSDCHRRRRLLQPSGSYSPEHGIPTVVATRSATSDLIKGDLVSVDAQQGVGLNSERVAPRSTESFFRGPRGAESWAPSQGAAWPT